MADVSVEAPARSVDLSTSRGRRRSAATLRQAWTEEVQTRPAGRGRRCGRKLVPLPFELGGWGEGSSGTDPRPLPPTPSLKGRGRSFFFSLFFSLSRSAWKHIAREGFSLTPAAAPAPRPRRAAAAPDGPRSAPKHGGSPAPAHPPPCGSPARRAAPCGFRRRSASRAPADRAPAGAVPRCSRSGCRFALA